jgi:hypothetical protein
MPPTAAAQLQYAVKPGQPVSWRSTPTMNPPLAKHKCLLTSVFRGPLSGCLQDMVRRGRYSPVAALRRATSCPGTLSAAPLSHTRRPQRGPGHATRRSRATFYFPQNYFVWGNKKVDSRPHNADARPPTGARSCRSSLPGSQPTLGLPCTRRGRRRTFSQPFLEISVRFPLASPAGPREPYRVAGLPCTQPSQAGAPRSLPGSPASAVQGSRAAYPGASARPHRRSVSPASPTGRRAH